ncbi:SRPBCC domain-containing protein [Mesorhizobium sp. B2-4-14]|uniref:SRPBCC family protein n=1 Tax=Mesorhizobium sp. B2-4-14 TaxID=2589935 RepID=UPI0011287D2E|nr:SRPBCC domain-containing protein [Mesorhizobium sp. B2-4-14]TPL03218.1 SRPBCC domain-containing protein [Mesorhizobium sp. B2-4-14]
MHLPTLHAMSNGDTVFATVDLSASPERVFRALSTDQVELWWGSVDTYRMVDWSADLRVGGRWTVVVRTSDGSDLPAGGEFLEIEAPRRIVQTRAYAWDHPTLGRRQTKVAWLLQPVAAGTRLTICHGGFAGLAEAAAEHADG